MGANKSCWLVVNSASGSNEPDAIAALEQQCTDGGLAIARKIGFPEDDLPRAEDLDDAGIDRLLVYAGDGTLNAAIRRLYGWSGAVLALPGGTMNLLCDRLHGEASAGEILCRFLAGVSRKARPFVIRCDEGDALAGLLAGPGASWSAVREAMRDHDVAALAQETTEAVAITSSGPRVRCALPALGQAEGYPLIVLGPTDEGLELDGYFAETAGDYLKQGVALLRRSFRDGPHERLGRVDEAVLESCEGEAIDILIDGEPATLPAQAKFTMARCEVDLLATAHAE